MDKPCGFDRSTSIRLAQTSVSATTERLADFQGSSVAKPYCFIELIGEIFVQCSSATLAFRRTTRTPRLRSRRWRAGCEKIYREKASGGRWGRPELRRLLGRLRKGDVLVVWRAGPIVALSPGHVDSHGAAGETKAGFKSLTEPIDTTTSAGRMMMQMFGAFAERCGSADA